MAIEPVLLTASSLAGVALGAGLQYLVGRDLETRKQLALQRSQSYIDYFKAVALAARDGRTKEILSAAADAKTRICIYGSPTVIDHLHEFEASGASTSSPRGKEAIVALLRAMRSDIGKASQSVSNHTLEGILLGPHNVDRAQ